LCVNTNKAVIVTNEPPKELYEKEPERVKEFENQIKKMENDFKVIVERVPLSQ